MRPNNPVLLNAVDATVTQYSAAVDAAFLYSGSFQAFFSNNSAAGTLYLQGTNEPWEELGGNVLPSHWVNIPNASLVVASGVTVLSAAIQLGYRWVRVQWVPTGGSAGTKITCNGMFISFN